VTCPARARRMITKIPQRIRCFIYVRGKIFVIMPPPP